MTYKCVWWDVKPCSIYLPAYLCADLIIVLYCIVDYILYVAIAAFEGFQGAKVLRLLKLFRIIRGLRAVRILRTIRSTCSSRYEFNCMH